MQLPSSSYTVRQLTASGSPETQRWKTPWGGRRVVDSFLRYLGGGAVSRMMLTFVDSHATRLALTAAAAGTNQCRTESTDGAVAATNEKRQRDPLLSDWSQLRRTGLLYSTLCSVEMRSDEIR